MSNDLNDGRTRREAARDGATRRESPPTSSPNGTRREAAGTRREFDEPHRPAAPTAPSRLQLPAELADYTTERYLSAGGEGYVLLARHRSGEQRVVKLYHPGITVDEKASELLGRADHEHVVEVLHRGVASDDGSRFEVLEWCELGSLGDVWRTDRGRVAIVDVVREVSSALEHVHSLRASDDEAMRLVHQDLKPDNVLVRALQPLDLVLGDFGLARMIAGSRHYTNRQQGSRPWAPPSGEAVSPAWDWWSLGMIVAELAGGHHPFEVNGSMQSDAVISDLLSQGPVDLSAVTDERLRLLCRGLLTRSTERRWDATQVAAWLAGESPVVADDVRVTDRGAAPATRRRRVHFAGQDHVDPRSLALAFQEHWGEAFEQIGQRADGNLVTDVELLLKEWEMPAAVAVLRDNQMQVTTRFAKLLVEMHDGLPPLLRGHDVRPGALLYLIDKRRTASTVTFLEDEVLGPGILRVWRDLEGMESAVDAERRMKEARAVLDKHRPTSLAALPAADKAAVSAALYAIAIRGDLDAAGAAAPAATAAAAEQPWWQALSSAADDPYTRTLARLTLAVAEGQTQEARARTAKQAEIEAARTALGQLPTRPLGISWFIGAAVIGYALSVPARELLTALDVERSGGVRPALPYIIGGAVALIGWLIAVTGRARTLRRRRALTELVGAPQETATPARARRGSALQLVTGAIVTLAVCGTARYQAGGSFTPRLSEVQWRWELELVRPLFGRESRLGVAVVAVALLSLVNVPRLARLAATVSGAALLLLAYVDIRTLQRYHAIDAKNSIYGYAGYALAGALLSLAVRRRFVRRR